MTAISAEDLSKSFRIPIKRPSGFASIKNYFFPNYSVIQAVSHLNFTVNQGERVAFIGPNGAGKSTTIKMLTGILIPSSGKVTVLGKDPYRNRKQLAHEMSVVFGNCSKLWQHLPVIESLDLFAAIYGIDRTLYHQRREELVHHFSVESLLTRVVRGLSLGERMRCELVASFLHHPKIVFLDEPTIGLDIIAKSTMRQLLLKLCKEYHCSLILTSHDTDDIEQVCERVILINEGKLVLDDSLKKIKLNYIKKKIVTVVAREKIENISPLPGLTVLDSSVNYIQCEVDLTLIDVNTVVNDLMGKYKIYDLTIEEPSLEKIIEQFYIKNG